MSANPIFLRWVEEWYEKAREKKTPGVTTYRNAYESLKACPLRFDHPAELQQLRGFGPKLCARLTEKYKAFCAENGLAEPVAPSSQRRRGAPHEDGGGDDDVEEGQEAAAAKRPRKQRAKKQYVPAFRSGAYAILLALSTLPEDAAAGGGGGGGGAGLTKARVIEVAQPLCDSSFSAPHDPTKFYTAWNAMKGLLERDLVTEKGRPLRKYALTDEGWEIARKLRAAALAAGDTVPPAPIDEDKGEDDDDDDDDDEDEDAAAPVGGDGSSLGAGVDDDPTVLPTFEPLVLAPHTFTVQLVLDVREVRSKMDRDYIQNLLVTTHGVRPVMRSLEVGDAMWIAKRKDGEEGGGGGGGGGADTEEVVLDYIVERKRMDDLVGSLKDGRFHEQKFRMRRSGIRNVTYLVEDIALDATTKQRYDEALTSAMAGLQVVNGYFLKRSQGIEESVRYLARMTRMLQSRYEARQALHVIPSGVLTYQNYRPLLEQVRARDPLVSWHISYASFASITSKSELLTLRDVFLKQLMTAKGVSGDKAMEIQRAWRTPREFVQAMEACATDADKKKLVSTALDYLPGRRKLGKAASDRLVEVWGGVGP